MSTDSNEAVLRTEGLTISFGGVKALDRVNLEVRRGEILAIIGPNGAGKTCILNCINNFYHPDEGKILFKGQDITGWPGDKIAGIGIARTFQNIELYTSLTTLENVMAGRHNFMKQNFITAALYFGQTSKEEIRHRRVAEDIIDFLEIESIRKTAVGVLPYGLRKRVELGRALALEPEVLLLDEPMAGMNAEEKEDLARFIVDIFEGQARAYPDNPFLSQGVKSIVLVEHDMGVVMDIADRIYVLDFGHVIAEDTPGKIVTNPRVIGAYLGKEEFEFTHG